MEASVSENVTAARQQKTDANYLPMAARKQNILWHLLCLSRMAADAKEIQTGQITSSRFWNVGFNDLESSLHLAVFWPKFFSEHWFYLQLDVLTDE